MPKEEFQNRERELSVLEQFLCSSEHKSSVMLLSAQSGVGKSRLTQKAVEGFPGLHSVRIKISSHAGASSEAFYYLEHMAESISKHFETAFPNFSVQKFLSKGFGKNLKSALLDDGERIAQKFYVPTGSLKTAINELRKTSMDSKSLNLNIHDASASLDYLQFALDGEPVIIILENCQNIDLRSYESLLKIIDECAPHKWIFEYTEEQLGRPTLSFDRLQEDLKVVGAQVWPTRLSKLELNYVANLIDPNAREREQILNLYLESDGNLRSLQDFNWFAHEEITLERDAGSNIVSLEDYQSNQKDALFQFTVRRIGALSRQEQLILIVLYIFGGEIDRDLFDAIGTRSLGLLQLIELETPSRNFNELIQFDKFSVSVSHDKILDALRLLEKTDGDRLKADFAAIKTALSFFLEALIKDPFYQAHLADIYWRLCKIYLDTNQENRVTALLDDLPLDLLTTGRIDKFVELLTNVETTIQDSTLPVGMKHGFFKKMVKVYHYSGNDAAALRCAENIKSNSISYQLLRASLLDLNSEHEKALNLLTQNVLSQPGLTQEEKLTSQLSEVMCLRSLNRHIECEEKYKAILGNEMFHNLDDFAIALRGAEMVLPFTQAEPLIFKSMKLLKRQGRILEAARAGVICGFIRTIIEDFEGAEGVLQEAENLFGNMVSERQSLLNNQSALAMYQGQLDDTIGEKLMRANISAKPEYDRIVLANNMLIYEVMSGRNAHWSAHVLEQLLEDVAVADKDIRRILHFNLSQYYQDHDMERSAKHLSLSKANNVNYLADIWQERWDTENWRNPRYKGLGEMPFIPTFLSYWTYDIAKLIENS